MSKYVRYIDAEGFRDDIFRQSEFIKVDDFQVLPVVDVVECLDNAPTINAIPVEWIKKWEQKEENYYLFKDLTRKLIEEWEKENEESSNRD